MLWRFLPGRRSINCFFLLDRNNPASSTFPLMFTRITNPSIRNTLLRNHLAFTSSPGSRGSHGIENWRFVRLFCMFINSSIQKSDCSLLSSQAQSGIPVSYLTCRWISYARVSCFPKAKYMEIGWQGLSAGVAFAL